MRQQRRSVREVLAGHEDAPYDPKRREFLEQIASALYERHEHFPNWTERVRFFYACYDLNYQVGNGGFAQAAYNIPHLIPVAQRAFEHLDRPEAASLCKKAIQLLPTELGEHLAKGLNDRVSLQEVFEHFRASDMTALDEQIPMEFWADEALQDLVQRYRQEFESVDEIRS